jgi:TetR/AcrR family transcriptional repressor of nem operon
VEVKHKPIVIESRLERFMGIGIAELMNEAGLTVGGFHKHFGSREELATEAIRSAAGRVGDLLTEA